MGLNLGTPTNTLWAVMSPPWESSYLTNWPDKLPGANLANVNIQRPPILDTLQHRPMLLGFRVFKVCRSLNEIPENTMHNIAQQHCKAGGPWDKT